MGYFTFSGKFSRKKSIIYRLKATSILSKLVLALIRIQNLDLILIILIEQKVEGYNEKTLMLSK